MKIEIFKKCVGCFLAVVIMTACNETAVENTNNGSLSVSDSTTDVPVVGDTVADVMRSIPSPIELMSLIKESGIKYNVLVLNNTENNSSYSTPFSQAINLGVYGADLGYINLYEKTGSSIQYLNAIHTLAENLQLGQFFDVETLKNLSENNKNLDSIILISTRSFERMNDFLSKQKRTDVGVLMLIGGWVESMHLAGSIVSATKHKEMMEKIGEQKVTLDQLIILLQLFKNDPAWDAINKDFMDLQADFEKVTISYEQKEAIEKEVDGQLVIEDNSTGKVEINMEQFTAIYQTIEKIRNNFIKG